MLRLATSLNPENIGFPAGGNASLGDLCFGSHHTKLQRGVSAVPVWGWWGFVANNRMYRAASVIVWKPAKLALRQNVVEPLHSESDEGAQGLDFYSKVDCVLGTPIDQRGNFNVQPRRLLPESMLRPLIVCSPDIILLLPLVQNVSHRWGIYTEGTSLHYRPPPLKQFVGVSLDFTERTSFFWLSPGIEYSVLTGQGLCPVR